MINRMTVVSASLIAAAWKLEVDRNVRRACWLRVHCSQLIKKAPP
jgi:hypothetical protein